MEPHHPKKLRSRGSNKSLVQEKMDFDNSRSMDPELWGSLQQHVNLENVYLKLPFREFFQLRGVCKSWNRLASERRCGADYIRKPYFVLLHDKELELCCRPLRGILTYQVSSGRWRWKALGYAIDYRQMELFKGAVCVQGLTFLCQVNGDGSFLMVREVCGPDRRVDVPRPQSLSSTGTLALGMAVDTSVMPHAFKIILGSLDFGTQVYDSKTKSWETRSSVLVPCKMPSFKTCLHCDDLVYIWSQLDQILVYSLQEDSWSTLKPPSQHEGDKDIQRALGAWQGRIFTLVEEYGGLQQPSLKVWELVARSKQEWSIFACVPPMLHAWLVPLSFQGCNTLPVFANFCNEYVLVYSLVGESGSSARTKRFVLFNLATTQWEKVEVSSASADRYDMSSYRHVPGQLQVDPDDDEDDSGSEEESNGEWDYIGHRFSEDRRNFLNRFERIGTPATKSRGSIRFPGI